MHRYASISAACAAAFAFAASPALAFNTFDKWDGASTVQAFGCPNTTTYGEVITIPGNRTHLNRFAFDWINLNTGSMVVRGEVYAWDGTKATGSALYESRPRTIAFNDSAFHRETFKTGVLPVNPGAQYVIFASIDKDYEQCQNNYILAWGFMSSDIYRDGFFVYQNNSGDENNWTTTTWNGLGGDLAFRAATSP